MARSEPAVRQQPSLRSFRGKVLSGETVSYCAFLFWGVYADQYSVGAGEKFRHAGLSGSKVGRIVPAELYAGRDTLGKKAV